MLIVSPRGWNFSHPFHTIGETFLLFLAETKIDNKQNYSTDDS